MTSTNLMECAECLCLASRRAARSITRAFDRKLRPHGIRITQFSALVNLSLRGPLTVGELADALGLERTTLTRNLTLIEDKGWIKTGVDAEDARARVVSITGKGRAALSGAHAAWREAQAAASAAFGSAGAKALRQISHAKLQ
jgi:DNA-binding MarR family transcriptional regulator